VCGGAGVAGMDLEERGIRRRRTVFVGVWLCCGRTACRFPVGGNCRCELVVLEGGGVGLGCWFSIGGCGSVGRVVVETNEGCLVSVGRGGGKRSRLRSEGGGAGASTLKRI